VTDGQSDKLQIGQTPEDDASQMSPLLYGHVAVVALDAGRSAAMNLRLAPNELRCHTLF